AAGRGSPALPGNCPIARPRRRRARRAGQAALLRQPLPAPASELGARNVRVLPSASELSPFLLSHDATLVIPRGRCFQRPGPCICFSSKGFVMNRSFDRALSRCTLSLLVTAACALQFATAQEELPPLPPLPAANANGDVLILRSGFHPPGPPEAGARQT